MTFIPKFDPNDTICEKHNCRGFCMQCYAEIVSEPLKKRIEELEAKINNDPAHIVFGPGSSVHDVSESDLITAFVAQKVEPAAETEKGSGEVEDDINCYCERNKVQDRHSCGWYGYDNECTRRNGDPVNKSIYMPSPPSIQQEAGDKRRGLKAFDDSMRSTLGNLLDSSPFDDGQQEAIPEDRISLILKLSEWLNKELVWQVNHVKNSPREFHKGALSAFESVAAKILELTAVQPSPPSVKTEREESAPRWVAALSEEGKDINIQVVEVDADCPFKSPFQQPSPAVKEGEIKGPALPDDIIHWVREAEDRYSHQKSDQDAYRAGATDMFWKHCHGIENPTRLSFVKFAYGCMNKRDALQSQLSALKKERDDYRDCLERIQTANPESSWAFQMSEDILLKYPIPQTPNNE